MNRMLIVFFAALALAVIVSLVRPRVTHVNHIVTRDVDYRTTTGFNVGAAGIVAILIALYATWW